MPPSMEVSVTRPVAEAARRESSLAQRLRSLALTLLLATGGCVLVAALIERVGVAALYALLGAAAPWLPLALALEAVRIVCEAQAARALYRGCWERWCSSLRGVARSARCCADFAKLPMQATRTSRRCTLCRRCRSARSG